LRGADALYYYGASWLDPALGRWIQPDAMIPDPSKSLDWDRFSYVRNSPLRYIDPIGHISCEELGTEECDENGDYADNEPPTSNPDPPFDPTMGGNNEGTTSEQVNPPIEELVINGLLYLGATTVIEGEAYRPKLSHYLQQLLPRLSHHYYI